MGLYLLSRNCPVRESIKMYGPTRNDIQKEKPYTIERICEPYSGATIALIRYHAATNYGGMKLLVYAAHADEVLAAELLDPHFCATGLSPVARFVPLLGYGMRLAMECARVVAGGETE